jgi:hypothetical protein
MSFNNCHLSVGKLYVYLYSHALIVCADNVLPFDYPNANV